MKADILKIAGVKSEKEFYKKFPTEEAFMEMHGAEFRKAMRGDKIKKAYNGIKDPPYGYNPDYMSPDIYAEEGENVFDPTVVFNTLNIKNKPRISYTPGRQTMKGVPAPLGYNLSGDPSAAQFDMTGKPITGLSAQQSVSTQGAAGAMGGKGGKLFGNLGGTADMVNLPGKVMKGIKAIQAEKEMRKSAQAWRDVSNLQLLASRTKPEPIERKYTRPEDFSNTGEPFFPVYGVGTNRMAKNGKLLNKVKGGNKTEIQNTYDPNTIYTDSGYAPLERADIGIVLGLAKDFIGKKSGQIEQLSNQIYGQNGQNAGSQLGGDIGGAVGNIFGPIGGIIGKQAGKFLGWALDRNPAQTKAAKQATARNVGMMAMNNMGNAIQQQNTSFVKDGGWISHDWQPQLITKFGEHNLSDLLKDDPTMDTLRTGGNIRQNTGISDFAMGGDLKTHWGGYTEPLSQNPYLPEGGVTVMPRGQSHDDSDGRGRTGIGITYGNNPVEVERGEPMVKLNDGASLDSDLVVFGNLKIPNQYIPMLGDPKAKGMKFKNYVAALSKDENKQNKLLDQSSDKLADLSVDTNFDKLTLNSYKANMLGANMKLKDLAEKKQNAGALQEAINQTASEFNLVADDLAKGNIKYAKKGANVPKAAPGITASPEGPTKFKVSPEEYGMIMNMYNQVLAEEPQGGGPKTLAFQEYIAKNYPQAAEAAFAEFGPSNKSRTLEDPYSALGFPDAWTGPRTRSTMPFFEQGFQNWLSENKPTASATATGQTRPPVTFNIPGADMIKQAQYPYASISPEAKKKGFDVLKMVSSALPYFRPSDAQDLDARQVAAEMSVLASNQLEPVPMQKFKPQLSVPYDISLQDILNENIAAGRAAQRMAGYNPAAQANIAAQQYAANQKVLGEQFRLNQEQRGKVYDQNRQILDNANLKNLELYTQQAEKQAIAKSNTKATTLAALDSISQKFLKNQLSSRTLKTYENLYNYRFGPDMIAQNWNPLQEFAPGAAISYNMSGFKPTYEQDEKTGQWKVVKWTPKTQKESEDEARNGRIVRALKNL